MAGASRIVGVLVLALAAVSLSVAYAADKTVYQYIIFGDSVTDTGNVFKDGGVPDPAIYFKGRFSNGPNWVDYINETLSSKHKVQIFNYATGGGVACRANLNSTRYPYSRDAVNQTGNFLADLAKGKLPTTKDTRRISLSWFAANDVIVGLTRALTSGADPATAGAQIVADLATCLAQHVATLAGAGVAEVALIPQSPVQVSPLVLDYLRPLVSQLVDAVDGALVKAVEAVNAQLGAAPAGSAASRAHVYLLGDSKWIGRIAPAVRPAFKYISENPCFVNPVSSMVLTPGIKVCENPNDYAFYDEIHPSTTFHKWFALHGLLPRLQLFRLAPRDV
ncbi:hypothetical protein HYH02_009903 [Chlamydomonas schloesseri]|uniref:Uncharacterized protein n=1 Tax=Chlamydomonas schloesseri TaxID=2026947 RepID=A0A835W6L0_9CHLO|nr:hypothetical protein HYH02_009903 [Chlamydomonas schloesseri]|eukprot:KAG2441310.1 hypothetical protein HYH02_009903 [Chlamydomonas schloesseri]